MVANLFSSTHGTPMLEATVRVFGSTTTFVWVFKGFAILFTAVTIDIFKALTLCPVASGLLLSSTLPCFSYVFSQ